MLVIVDHKQTIIYRGSEYRRYHLRNFFLNYFKTYNTVGLFLHGKDSSNHSFSLRDKTETSNIIYLSTYFL